MNAAHLLRSCQIRDRSRHAQHSRIAAGREPHGGGGLHQQLAARLIRAGEFFQRIAVELGIGPRAARLGTVCLALARVRQVDAILDAALDTPALPPGDPLMAAAADRVGTLARSLNDVYFGAAHAAMDPLIPMPKDYMGQVPR